MGVALYRGPVTVRRDNGGMLDPAEFRIKGWTIRNPEFTHEAAARDFVERHGRDGYEYALLPVTFTGWR